MKKELNILLLCLSCNLTAFADTFIVTNYSDSGSGSLREAITLANSNGTSSTDYIHFNIPELVYNSRLIHLETELPALSSNIIIDGSTQPGASYGTTNTKICLVKLDYVPAFTFLNIENAENVKIYGLQLYYGYWEGLFSSPSRSNLLYGIAINNSRKIEIGSPSKGNVIGGVVNAIYSNSENCSDIVIRSNYLGQGHFYENGTDDIDPVIVNSQIGIAFANVSNITIGGPKTPDGNFFGNSTIAISVDSKNAMGNGYLIIQNNFLGYKFDTTVVSDNIFDSYIHVGRSRRNPAPWTNSNSLDYSISLLDNKIAGTASFKEVTGTIKMLRNIFEYTSSFGGGYGTKLSLVNCSGGTIIGNDDEADGNYFLNNKAFFHGPSVFIVGGGPITIGKNVFKCNSILGSTTSIRYDEPGPFIQIDVTTEHSVEGRADPNTKIDIFYDDECSACEGKKYVGTTHSDESGHWKYEGFVGATVVAFATTDEGYSGEFSRPTADISKIKIVQPSCGKTNGSITQISTEGADSFFWINRDTKDTVCKTLDLIDVSPGFYILYGVHGGTCTNYLYSEELADVTPKINVDAVIVNQPSCGLKNGSIEGIVVYNGYHATYNWKNNVGESLGMSSSIEGLWEGEYYFVVTDTLTHCSDSVIFYLKNITGPSLNTSNIKIVSATCGQNNGSILDIFLENVTGSPFIQWVDSANQPVSNELELKNAFPGKYKLLFKDKTACDTIITSYFEIKNLGDIQIDTSAKKVIASKCSESTGKIEGIKVTGADEYQWINLSNNSFVGNQIDVYDLPPGSYKLKVGNNFLCELESTEINVPQETFNFVSAGLEVQNALCGLPNGSIKIISFDKDTSGYQFYWEDSSTSNIIGTRLEINNLGAGHYFLFGKDASGCEGKISSISIKKYPVPSIDDSEIKIVHDQCDQKLGQIKNLKVKDLIGPTIYTWYNAHGEEMGNSINLVDIVAGTYTLQIIDVNICRARSNPIIVQNSNVSIEIPKYDDVTVLRNSNAELKIKNIDVGHYYLYRDPLGKQLIRDNDNGNFLVTHIFKDTSFYIRKRLGSCESPLETINISVVDKFYSIPNAFSPNGDGVNDQFKINNPSPTSTFRLLIFNRFGQKVFETGNANEGWDGTYMGKLQPVGIYTWSIHIIEPDSEHFVQRGIVTLIR